MQSQLALTGDSLRFHDDNDDDDDDEEEQAKPKKKERAPDCTKPRLIVASVSHCFRRPPCCSFLIRTEDGRGLSLFGETSHA